MACKGIRAARQPAAGLRESPPPVAGHRPALCFSSQVERFAGRRLSAVRHINFESLDAPRSRAVANRVSPASGDSSGGAWEGASAARQEAPLYGETEPPPRTAAFWGNGGGKELPTQGDAIVSGVDDELSSLVQVVEKTKSGASDLDYLQELIAIQQSGPKILGFFGTRNMGFMHQQLIEILSYAMVLTV